ncbi:MAG: methionine gamma-lyase family protein, partial [Candidatus Melainabacteria bacterium]|nr:methionine gamma-lyase family protein [Candidatus Melainabacteria bacterium]
MKTKISLDGVWQRIDQIKKANQIKVLEAFKQAGVQNSHYAWVTGYGYDDLGKDKLDELYAAYFNTEAALVRPQLVSGTHAIASAIFGNLNSGDRLVAIGQPYDTLQTVFNKWSKKFGIDYYPNVILSEASGSQCGIKEILTSQAPQDDKRNLFFIQRSRGYEWRDSYSLNFIAELIEQIKSNSPQAIVFVDNCYGEFTQEQEPTDIGADIIAGSLIKNPGGGIVAAGAYIAGRESLVENAAEFMTAPGIGKHGGCNFDQTRLMMQGFFMAPLIVSEALKGMSYAAKVFEELGLETLPAYDAERNDIIQAIKFNNRDKLIEFCRLVQTNCPVNSMFAPVPDAISGYDDEIIMASGSFIEGSSIELSADGPLREPYIGYFQGGLSSAHTIYVVDLIAEALSK